jgi:23S rRNA (guanosine2251-2'-O)-methyltransferase
MKLCGKNPVVERIKTDPGSIKKIYLQKRTELSEVVKELKKTGLAFESVEKKIIDELCPAFNTQGVVAEVVEFKYTPFRETVLKCLAAKTVIVFVDGVTDPQNLGGIIRSLACLGGFSVVIPEHGSAMVNETVLRVANGGENYVDICALPNIATAVRKARAEGIMVAGAVLECARDIRQVEFRAPLAVVIGSEGKGVRPGILKELDIKVSLPMDGAALSYNAAVATALVCYEIKRSFR